MKHVQRLISRRAIRSGLSADDILRLEAIVREKFSVEEHDLIFVRQDIPFELGFPPDETNIVFFKGSRRYRIRIFKPLDEVSDIDMPIAWLLPSLEDFGCGECC